MTSWKNNNTLNSRRLVEEVLDPVEESRKIVAEDRDHLIDLVVDRIKKYGPGCDLNDIDVSHVADMTHLFTYSKFNGDISKWDVSNAKDTSHMFDHSSFNGDISKWNVSNVRYMYCMFIDSKFSGDISKWNVSKVKNKTWMFKDSPLEGKEPDWYKR